MVLDRDLPGIHGDRLCQIITRSENPAMILMLTVAGAPDDRVSGLALGADDSTPNRSTSPNSSCASGRSRAAN